MSDLSYMAADGDDCEEFDSLKGYLWAACPEFPDLSAWVRGMLGTPYLVKDGAHLTMTTVTEADLREAAGEDWPG